MKTIFRIAAFIILTGIFTAASAHDSYTKVLKKEFTVNPDAQLIIDNSFGKVHCNNWDKNIIQIEVTITIEASNEKDAARLFDRVNINIEGSSSQVEARTVIQEGGFFNGKGHKIDYVINMPATINLDLTNKFGDIYINELGGKGRINLSYGNMEAGKFTNSDNLLDIKFSNADVKSMKGAVLNLKYSRMNLGYAGSIRLDSKYSDLEAEKIISLVMNFEGGKLKLGNGAILEGKGRFSDLIVKKLDQSLTLDIQYGKCEVDEMPADFSGISVKNKYGDINIGLPSTANYALDAELKFCDLDFPEQRANISQRMTTNTSKTYKATIGKESAPTAKVYVRSEYGNVSLE